jgi:hypothetical protein
MELSELVTGEVDRDPVASEAGPLRPIVFSEDELAAACAGAVCAAVSAERASAASELHRLRRALLMACTDAIGASRSSLGDLRTELAKRAAALLGSALSFRPDPAAAQAAIEDLLGSILTEIAPEPTLRLHLAPADATWLGELMSESLAAAAYKGTLEILPNEAVPPSTVRIEWRSGWAETDLEAAIRRLRSALADAAGTAGPQGQGQGDERP